ncbi:hypothetical protein BOX15_Mlig018147g1 [Macrostomum lignano]|uniref:protein-tyrosine-phosphatase n=2 Tax=Macrostomum lignano TaxID=282301 RepID=A0A267E1C0_9PLAT|nr:hypothetical protein BOX15_Mlig018147g1 [Macrostomum lignano]
MRVPESPAANSGDVTDVPVAPGWLIPLVAGLGAVLLLLLVLLLIWCCHRRLRGDKPECSGTDASAGSDANVGAVSAVGGLSASFPPLATPSFVQRRVQPNSAAASSSASISSYSAASSPLCQSPQLRQQQPQQLQQKPLAQQHRPASRQGSNGRRQAGLGLLGSRRGSSASLTISLSPSCEALRQEANTPDQDKERSLLESLSQPLRTSDLLDPVGSPQARLFREFWSVPMHHAGREELPEAGAVAKNRYASIVPNAATRVALDDGGYINANFVRGAGLAERRFIATQGPLAETLADFWQMIWEQRPSAIVMLTDLVERDRPKCELYFPLHVGDRMRHGRVTAELLELDNGEQGFQRRLLRLDHTEQPSSGESLLVEHLWFRSWPDHTSPDSAVSLLPLAERSVSLPGLLVVHCSAGLGRTGAFCALCICIRQLLDTGACDCLATLCRLRLDRGGMVQSHEQYEFLHTALRHFALTRLATADR